MIFNRLGLGHNSLSGFLLGNSGKAAKIIVVSKDVGCTDTSGNAAAVYANGIKAKTKATNISPKSGGIF